VRALFEALFDPSIGFRPPRKIAVQSFVTDDGEILAKTRNTRDLEKAAWAGRSINRRADFSREMDGAQGRTEFLPLNQKHNQSGGTNQSRPAPRAFSASVPLPFWV
jgi:hypothetical protein